MKSPGMTTCSRKFSFDSGHRVLGHKGKCRHLHGHTYLAEVTCAAAFNDKLGMVIDFSEVKSRVGGWIETVLDHNLILHPQDPLFRLSQDWFKSVHDRIPFVMPGDTPNPTAENIAKVILEKVCEVLAPVGIVCLLVRLWETPNCYADYYHPNWINSETSTRFVLKELNRDQPAPPAA